jgi:hypothetical protein
LQLTPQIPVTNLDGSWGGSDPVNGANQYAPINPIAIANLITNNNKRRQVLGGLNIGINLAKGLVFRTSLNGNMGDGLSTYYTPTYNIDQWHYNTLLHCKVELIIVGIGTGINSWNIQDRSANIISP